jgi:hypothetical protein
MEVRHLRGGPASRGDARIFAVLRRRIERADQRSPFVGANWRTIQPFDSIQRSARRADRPFAPGAIDNRQRRDLARRVVSRDHGISGAPPAIVALGVGRRPAHPQRGPPVGRVDRDRVELHEIAHGPGSASRNSEHDSRAAIGLGQVEAARIEAEPGDRIGRSALVRAQRRSLALHRVARGVVPPPSRGAHPESLSLADDVAERGFPARPQIHHAAPRRVPRAGARRVDVDVILI